MPKTLYSYKCAICDHEFNFDSHAELLTAFTIHSCTSKTHVGITCNHCHVTVKTTDKAFMLEYLETHECDYIKNIMINRTDQIAEKEADKEIYDDVRAGIL